MKRWQMTLGLAGAAVVAAALAPRLTALWTPPADVAPPITPPIPEVAVDEVVEATPEVEQGRLIVRAGLDRRSVLDGTTSERFLTITVTAPADEGTPVRQPVNVAVVMDASGSMGARGKIDYAKRAAKEVVKSMNPNDAFSLITFNDTAKVVVQSSMVTQPERLFRKIDQVYEGGGTNLYAGMSGGQAQILSTLDQGEVGKLVILSDGKANVGVSDPSSLAHFASEAASRGITVTTLGLGTDFREDVLANLADVGGGNYAYIDTPQELSGVFRHELEATTRVVARSTAVSIDLPPNVQPVDLIGWPAERTQNGWSVFVGDIPAGSTRKIVTRVRVDGRGDGPLEVARVRANYTDLVDGVPGVSSDVAMANVTADADLVKADIDAAMVAEANRAWGNHFLEQSTRAFEAGDLAEAQKMIAEGSGVLRRAASQGDAPELAVEADAMELQLEIFSNTSPRSREGRRAIKMNKETVRDAYR